MNYQSNQPNQSTTSENDTERVILHDPGLKMLMTKNADD
jgi:hypothetical protein